MALEMPKGVQSTQGMITTGDSPSPKKRKEQPMTKEEIEAAFKKETGTRSRLTREIRKVESDLQRMEENFNREHEQGLSSRQAAVEAVADGKSGLEIIQKAASQSTAQIEKTITRTKTYLGDLRRELFQSKMRTDRLNRELQTVQQIEMAVQIKQDMEEYFKVAGEQKERYRSIKARADQLRSVKNWGAILDKVGIGQVAKVAIDTIIPRSRSPQVFETEMASLGGPYCEGNVFFQEYYEMDYRPHDHLRFDRGHFGVNPSGQLTEGGPKLK